MSKTLEKNLIAQGLKTYWKRFAEWAISLRTRYQQDLFFRTECNIILFQSGFALALLALVTLAFNYLYQRITQTLIQGIIENISHMGTVTSYDLFHSLETIRAQNFISVLLFFFTVTIIAGYVASRVALAPARNALTSQKRFISNVAHELRTPLSIMKTNNEVALLDETLDPDIRKILKSDIEELNRASEIINNLLSLNNFIRPEKMSFTDVDLGEVVDVVAKKMKALAERKEIRLIVKKKGRHIVLGNNTALEQILINLVRNAISYTPNKGLITVSVEPDYRGNVLLSVQDTGIGIAQKDLLHIFEPFYRAETSRNRQSGSSGLGLTIVSELVRLHSGKITIRSMPRKGTIATVLFPYNKQKQEDSATPTAGEVSIDFSEHSPEA